MLGAGLFALRVREQAPPPIPAAPGKEARPAAEPRPPGAPDAIPLRRDAPAPAPRIALPQPPKREPRGLSGGVAGGTVGTVEGGVPGGVVGGVPALAPPPAPAAQPVQAPAPKPAPREEERITGVAESPLVDERQAARDRESKKELKDFDHFSPDAAAKPAAPAGSQDVPVLIPKGDADRLTDRINAVLNPEGADQLTDRINVGGNESGQQASYAGPGARAVEEAAKAKERPPHPSLAAAAPPALAAPFRDTAAGRRLTYEPGADSGSCEHARRELAAGRLPAPGSVRVGDFLGFLDSGGAGRRRLEKQVTATVQAAAQVLEAAGAPDPFGDARSRLLLFRLRGGEAVPAGARMEVELNPAVVARYREIGAGPGLSTLYEVELRDDAASGRIATLRVHGLPALQDEERELALSGLAASWETASPGFRLAALAAELAESLKGYPWAPRDLGAIARQIREAARGVAGNPRAAELAALAEAAARLRARLPENAKP